MQRSIFILTCALFPLTASAQRFSFGVQGGFPAQTPLDQTNSRMPFVLGPKAEVHVFRGLSFSTGMLFSRAGRKLDTGVFVYPDDVVNLYGSDSRSRAVEVPLLAKHHFFGERRNWRPFVTAGAAIRRTLIETTAKTSVVGPSLTNGMALFPVGDNSIVKWNLDPVGGVGIDFRSGRFHLEPEIRYSHWGAGKHTEVRSNQVQFLLGFRF